jgi:succinate dehydrogenase/fumarate reductase flavoprotein subunit
VVFVEADVVVAGGGAGAITAAYNAHRCGASVLLLGGGGAASDRVSSINTALGYSPEDTPAGLFDDTYRASGYLGNTEVIAEFTSLIGSEIENLHRMGVPFLAHGDQLARRQATGSTWTRSVYSVGLVGAEIAHLLLAELENDPRGRFRIVRGGLALRLRRDDHGVTGGLGYDPRNGKWFNFACGATVLATGGAGQIFANTTNPAGHRGTGYSMALEIGADLVDMEFISFEPFVSTTPAAHKGDDLPTTVLKEGARLLNGRGDEFIDTQKSLTKDIICRAMMREVQEGRGTPSGSVVYDIREMDTAIVGRYVQIRQALDKRGLTPSEGLIEVMPAQHYLMGGIVIDRRCATTIPGLYALGEVSGGVHGAHRLAGGGGMEIVVGGAIAGTNAAGHAADHRHRPTPGFAAAPALLGRLQSAESRVELDTIRRAMNDGCGVLRNQDDLSTALDTVLDVRERTAENPDSLAHRAATLSATIAATALARTESRGDHFRTDHPQRDDRNWLRNQHVQMHHRAGLTLDGAPLQRSTAALTPGARERN